MFSRTGASTVQKYKAFSSKFSDINEMVEASKNQRKAKRKGLAEDDVDPDASDTEKLPAIAETEENGPVLEVPGLQDELGRLEKHYKQM